MADGITEIKVELAKISMQGESNASRLDEVEKKLKENTDLIIAINGLTHEVKYMREDINAVTKRVDKIDSRDAETWKNFKWVLVVAVVGIVVGFLAKTVGLK